MTQVFKIAKIGKNARSTDPNDFVFHSSYNTFKILFTDLLINQSIDANPKTILVAHNQSVIPTIFAFVKFPDGYIALPNQTDHAFTVSGGRSWHTEVDKTNIKFIFDRASITGTSQKINMPSDDASRGTIPWTNWNEGWNDDNHYAYADFSGGAKTSHNLKYTGFGFNIPTSATITGIRVRKEGYYDGSLSGNSRAQLVKGGSPSGDVWTQNFGTSENTFSRGDNTDMWGLTLTPNDINASNFGFILWSDISDGAGKVYIDWADITVYYTDDGGNYEVNIRYYIFESPI
jgi:hypothetical protein